MNNEFVVLVDRNDLELGLMKKMDAHINAMLHRAFSIFIFNSKGEMLLQQRALNKYHSPGLWTNTCCSHPRSGESLQQATSRRLLEEMGMHCEMNKAFDFIYKADVGQGLTEHEFDHVFIGYSDMSPVINKEEVENWKYVNIDAIKADMSKNPDIYTVWFRIAFDQLVNYIKTNNLN
ncbi:MAG: isopentenyl-diphosphate delta-isomerase [Bacteroidetes bacterium HGW-Bacteroidetes-1]|jgi:isopentenyl-diphosphate delta-isomerase|nr:MAG: isopentenyl-diphosphate delta-isomerase [Bacteroidetes bacterium HGW-Bacteroidetes-1]